MTGSDHLAEETVDPTRRPPLDIFLRGLVAVGYTARAALYLVVGVVALLAVWGPEEPAGTHAALAELLSAPHGTVALTFIGAGLLCYSAWRFLQGVWDVDGRGRRLYPLLVRLGFVTSCGTYAALAVYAFLLAAGASRDDDGLYDWTQALLGPVVGRVFVGFAGFCVICMGLAQLVIGWSETYRQRFTLSWREQAWARVLARLGLTAKAVVFGIFGGLLIYAAWTADTGQKRGLGDALVAIQRAPLGEGLLTFVASGLVAYAAYSIVMARYRDASWRGIPVRFGKRTPDA